MVEVQQTTINQQNAATKSILKAIYSLQITIIFALQLTIAPSKTIFFKKCKSNGLVYL